MGASGGDGAGIGGAREAGLSNNVPNNHNTRNETMPLILVGLGLGDAKDITLRGLEVSRSRPFLVRPEYLPFERPEEKV